MKQDLLKMLAYIQNGVEVVSAVKSEDSVWTVTVHFEHNTGLEALDQARAFNGYDKNDYMSIISFGPIDNGNYVYKMKRVIVDVPEEKALEETSED